MLRSESAEQVSDPKGDWIDESIDCAFNGQDYLTVQDYGNRFSRMYMGIHMCEKGDDPVIVFDMNGVRQLRDLLTRIIERKRS